jgi:hypothetical protein
MLRKAYAYFRFRDRGLKKRYRTPFSLQVLGFAGARGRFFCALDAGCIARRRGRGPRRAGWSSGDRGVRPGDYACESWLSNPQFEILNSQFAIQNSQYLSPLPRATTCTVAPGAFTLGRRGIPTRNTGRPRSSISGYGFRVFVLLTPRCRRIENPLLGNQAVTALKVSGTILISGARGAGRKR